MIGVNLGKYERIVRFAIGALLLAWVVMQPEMNGFSWFMSVIGLFLVLNGIYGRCYLWHILDISSCGCNQVPRQQFCDRAGT